MRKKLLFCLIIFPLIFTSCNNELDIIGEWKEVAIVYGLLDPAEPVNYVRVQKAFLGEGNALIMAQQHDSIYYGGEITVVLERRMNGQLMSTIIMERDSSITKDPGIFATEGHIVYKTEDPILNGSEYSLVVHNEKTGYTATSHTPVVDDITWVNPNPNPIAGISWVDVNGNITPITVVWRSGADSRVFQLTMRFYYGQRTLSDLNADTSFIDLTFPSIKSKNTLGNENLSMVIPGEDFFNFLLSRLTAPHPDTVRVAGRVEFIVTSGAEDFSTYLDIINAGTGVSQSTPVFTNVNSGLGVFSSRTTQGLSKRMNSITIDALACRPELKHLKFLMNNQQVCP